MFLAIQITHVWFSAIQIYSFLNLHFKSTHIWLFHFLCTHFPKCLFSESLFGVNVLATSTNHTCAPLTITHSPILSPPIKYHSHHTSRFLTPTKYHTWPFFPHLLSPTIPCHSGRTPAKQCQQRRRQGRKQDDSQRSPLWQLRPRVRN